MFFDFISPIVVKEIRQGLKSRFFSSTYLILQGLMVFSILLYLTTLSLSSNVSTINGFFWLFLGIPLVLVMPIRAFNAIHEENKNKTLEENGGDSIEVYTLKLLNKTSVSDLLKILKDNDVSVKLMGQDEIWIGGDR